MTVAEQKLYTLEEAKEELAKTECVKHGHDLQVLLSVQTAEPASIHCGRCDRTWKVVESE